MPHSKKEKFQPEESREVLRVFGINSSTYPGNIKTLVVVIRDQRPNHDNFSVLVDGKKRYSIKLKIDYKNSKIAFRKIDYDNGISITTVLKLSQIELTKPQQKKPPSAYQRVIELPLEQHQATGGKKVSEAIDPKEKEFELTGTRASVLDLSRRLRLLLAKYDT